MQRCVKFVDYNYEYDWLENIILDYKYDYIKFFSQRFHNYDYILD